MYYCMNGLVDKKKDFKKLQNGKIVNNIIFQVRGS